MSTAAVGGSSFLAMGKFLSFRLSFLSMSTIPIPRHLRFIEGTAIVTTSSFLKSVQCEEIISICERFSICSGGWGDESQEKYAQKTKDLEVENVKELVSYFNKIEFLPALNLLYQRIYGNLIVCFDDFFVVKYEYAKQSELVEHFDGGDITFMIALSNRSDYDGGGTLFKLTGEVLELDQGCMVIFDAKLLHR